jgi:hypothetical protein
VKIVHDGYVRPSLCPVFNQELTYLSYGDVAFRPSRDKPSWNDRFPVVLMFRPSIIRDMWRFFPFDTGAIAAGRFRGLYCGSSYDFRSYTIPKTHRTSPPTWIQLYFGSNNNYLQRTISTWRGPGFDQVLSLRESCIYCESMRYKGMHLDYHLISTIECHYQTRISLKNLTWIGIPTRMKRKFTSLCYDKLSPGVSVFYYAEEDGCAGLNLNVISEVRRIMGYFA